MVSDDGAGDDGLAGAGWGDEHAEVVAEHGVVCGLLLGLQLRGEFEGVGLAVGTLIGDLQATAGLGDERVEPVVQAAG